MDIYDENLTNKANLKKSGNVIRKYCKEHNIKQIEFANIIGYTGRSEASQCWNGVRLLKLEKYKLLSKEWNLRIEYLLGIDDYPTISDLLEYTKTDHDKTLEIIYLFLESHGYKISNTNYVSCNGYYYELDNNQKYNHWEYKKVLEVTSPNNKKCFINQDQIYNLVGDFFSLFKRRLIPCEIAKILKREL